MSEFDDLLSDLDGEAPARTAATSPLEARSERRGKVRNVQRLLAVFLKAGKTLRLYTEGTEHRFFNRFTDEFIERLDDVLGLQDSLTLEITPYAINWDGDVVFENREQRENLAFKLYRDGVRLLQFRRGVHREELRDFVTLIAREVDAGNVSKDLSVLFWEADFKHIHMAVAETFVEYTEEAARVLEDIDAQLASYERSFELEVVEGKMARDYEPLAYERSHDLSEAEGDADGEEVDDKEALPDIPEEIYSSETIERIFEDLHGLEDPYATFEEVGTVVAEVVLAEEDADELSSFLKHLDDALSNLLATASIGPLNSILRRLSLIDRGFEESDDPRARVVRDFFVKFCDGDRLTLLARAINTDWDVALKGELFCFIGLQHTGALDHLIRFLGNVVVLEARRVITDSLILLLGRQADPWLPATRSENWHVVADAVYALGRLGDAMALDHVMGTFAREEHQVRVEVLKALRPHQSPRIYHLMLDALEDDHPDVRLGALRYLTVYRVQDAVPAINKGLGSKGFGDREFEERRGWYIALGHLAGSRVLRSFVSEADKFRGTNEVTEGVHLALLGVRATRSAEGRKYLQSFAQAARGDLQLLSRRLMSEKKN
jgi:hypothetical protein